MESPTSCLEVGNQLPQGGEGVVCLDPLEFADPHVFNNADDEFPYFAFRGFICCVIADSGLVYCLIYFS